MPLYSFVKVNDSYIFRDFFFRMKDVPSVGSVIKDDDGIEWKRVFTIPQAASNITKIDPNSPKDFNRRLENKNLNIGELWDSSAEMSEARAAKNGGTDPIKEKYYEKYSAERQGAKHPKQKKEEEAKRVKEQNKKLEKLGISIKINQ